jgi:hypothetical protein
MAEGRILDRGRCLDGTDVYGCPLPMMVSWIGLQKIIDWLLDIPTSLILFVLSIIVVAICAMIEAVLTMPQQEKR